MLLVAMIQPFLNSYIDYAIIIMSNTMSVKLPKGKAGFISKLQTILSDHQLVSVITWSSSGNSFLIRDAEVFETRVLCSYFRHKRMSSFIRQLNMYGFHKQRSEKEALQFYHPFFKKQRPDLFPSIERKKVSQVTFKENQLESTSKGSRSQFCLSDKCMPSIKVIEPEQEWMNQASFRFNGSKMTIRLNEGLTSLCEVDYDEDAAQVLHMDGKEATLSIEESHQQQKNGQYQNCFMVSNEQERQINFF